MAGSIPSRSSTRKVLYKAPEVSSDDSSGEHGEELSDTTVPESNVSPGRSTTSARGDDSRLSQGLEPMHLDDEYGHTGPDPVAHDEIDPLGKYVKEVTATLRKLEGLGLQQYDISLPRCIVLGQQSTGKSSVIEAISGIQTPRDTDTCTCCPLYINMQPSDGLDDGWRAQVSLQLEYVLDTHPQAAKNPLFRGWINANPRKVPFMETRSRKDLENIIRAAQLAILNPLEDPRSFLNNPRPRGNGHQQNKFSPNTVCIDITEPGLASLSFFDLPGLISQAETEDEEYTVDLVQNLVGKYVEAKDSLILVTCDLGTDIANSTAAGLARRHGATDRCVGVLTKPDLLAPGTTDTSLINVLDGKRFKLGHEYFVVKNLNKEEIQRGLGHRDARISEVEFFKSGRWSTSLRRFQSRFGTLKLQIYLSKQLAKQTLASLPGIHQQILTQLGEVEDELSKIPVTPAHSAVRVISDVVLEFCSEVRREMEGEHNHMEWRNMWDAIRLAFSDALVAMKPKLKPKGNRDVDIHSSTLPGSSANDALVVDSEDEHGSDVQMGTDDVPTTPFKKRKLEETTPAPPSKKTPAKTPMRQPPMTPSKGSVHTKRSASGTSLSTNFTNYKIVFSLDDVARDLGLSAKGKLPKQTHPKVIETMVLSPLQEWNRPVEFFFDCLQNKLLLHMRNIFDKHFGKRRGTDLYRRSWQIVEALLQNNINQQKTTMAEETLHDEFEGPYIFHEEVFNKEKAVMRELYSQHRLRTRFRVYVTEAGHHLGRELSQIEQDKVRKDTVKMSLIAHDPYADLIDLIAEVTSYYNLASRRLHDSICMRVESKFFKQLRTQLREEIETGLGIYDDEKGPANAQRLLAESLDREVLRQRLVARKEALQKGLAYLEDLDNKYRDEPPVNATGEASSGFGGSDVGMFLATPPNESN